MFNSLNISTRLWKLMQMQTKTKCGKTGLCKESNGDVIKLINF